MSMNDNDCKEFIKRELQLLEDLRDILYKLSYDLELIRKAILGGE